MENKSKNWVVIVIIVAILAVGLYFIFSASNNQVTETPVTDTGAVPVGFETKTDSVFGYAISYPGDSAVRLSSEPKDVFARDLSFVESGTNLHEKYFTVSVEATTVCAIQSNEGVTKSETITKSGVSFLREETASAGAGNYYLSVGYSILKNSICYRLQFFLHSVNKDNYPVPPKEYDVVKESKVFDDIFATWKVTGVLASSGTYTNEALGLQLQYPSIYMLVPGDNRHLVGFEKASSTAPNYKNSLHISVMDSMGATSFEDYLIKKPILNENTGQVIAFSKFTPVTIGGKTFYYIVGERFEGYFGTKYYYYTTQNIYLFESNAYIAASWTDPKFDTANEQTHKDLKQALSTLTFTK